MKLKRFLLRYFPPGIILEYENNGETKQKTVDLLDLTVDTDAEVLLVRKKFSLLNFFLPMQLQEYTLQLTP